MVKGGYTLVDCTGLNLGNLGKVDGIYNKMMSAYKENKVVYCANVVNGDAHFTPIPAFLAIEVIDEKDVIILTIMNIGFRVNDDDTVTMGNATRTTKK